MSRALQIVSAVALAILADMIYWHRGTAFLQVLALVATFALAIYYGVPMLLKFRREQREYRALKSRLMR